MCTSSLDQPDQSLTGVDILVAVYVVVANFVAPLMLMAFFYSRIYRTVRLHKMSVVLRDVLITEVVERRSKRLMVAVVGVFAVMTAPLAVALSTTMIVRRHTMPAFVVFVIWIMQLMRTLSHPVLYGVCNTMFARCMLRTLRCRGPLRHGGHGRSKPRGSSARQRPGSGNPLAGEIDQNEEISTIAPLPLDNCHCSQCPQCKTVQPSVVGVQPLTTSGTSNVVQTATPTSTGAGPAARHGCKLSSCSHCSHGGRYSSRSSVPTIFRMQLSQPRWYRSSSNCSQTSQMMVGGRTPGADSSRSSFFSQRGQFSTRVSVTSGAGQLTQSSSSSSSSATRPTTAAAAARSDVSSTSLAHYIYEHCASATSVQLPALLQLLLQYLNPLTPSATYGAYGCQTGLSRHCNF